MQGKVCLVTGSNSGIGKVTARELAQMGATVVMLCRNRAKGEAAQAEIVAATNNEQVDLLVADLALQAEVRRVAEEFKQKYQHLHILINNAGGANNTRKVTPDGLEATFATNHLAPFLLTELLLDTLKASAPARIVNVSSVAHAYGKIDFEDLQCQHGYSWWKAYCQSKLAMNLCTYELANQLKGTGVTVNALHPGTIASNFGANMSGPMRWGMKLVTPFIATVEQGAQTTLYLATSPEVEGVTGKYFARQKEQQAAKRAYDEAARLRLWQVSTELTR